MQRLLLFPALLMAWCAGAAQAQIVSVYGTFSPVHVSGVASGSIPAGTGFTPQYASQWGSGVGGGVTFNFLPIGPVKLGFDLRGSTKFRAEGTDTAMGGFRVSLKAPLIPLKPYAQVSGGYVATYTANRGGVGNNQPNGGVVQNRYAAYEVIGGVDYSVFPFVDLRLAEVGVGRGYDVFGSTNQTPMTLFTVNTGVVVHF